MTDYTDLKRRGITVWTLDGEYDLWSMQHPEGRHKDEYEGQWVKADDVSAAIAALEAERDALLGKVERIRAELIERGGDSVGDEASAYNDAALALRVLLESAALADQPR